LPTKFGGWCTVALGKPARLLSDWIESTENARQDWEKIPMKTRVQKWGNSLALRIPKSFAVEAGIREDASVEMSLQGGRLVIQPLPEKRLTLGDLLKGVTDQNLHGEWDTGPAVGKEVW
jgi:antitoxin MazE